MRPSQLSPRFRRARRLHEAGELDAAEQLYAEILRRDPRHFDALHLTAMLHYQRGRLERAEKLLRAALALDPCRADAQGDLGLVLLAAGRAQDAVPCYEAACRIAPEDADTHNGLGVAWLRIDRIAEALASFDRALALCPDHVGAFGNRGNALLKLNRVHEAIASFDAGLRIAPKHARLLTNRAIALRRIDCPREALMDVSRARACTPDFAEARFVESLIRLTLGDFAAGWEAYEHRWATAAFAAHRRKLARPLWLGDRPLAGKTILLYAEQGYGDTIQFVRYAPRVAALGARVVLEVQAVLARLLAASLPVEVVAHGRPLPEFDLQCPLMSLPLALRTTLSTIPADIPYLAPPAEKAQAAPPADDRAPGRPLRIGIAWAGDPLHKNDLNRSLQLAKLRPLFDLPQIEFTGLQQEISAGDAELAHALPQLSLAGPFADFAATATAIAPLDAVIAVDTAVAHLAGAIGKPLFLLLPYGADFRWLRGRSDSPWYPTARLFRQHAFGDWGRAIEALCHELSDWSAAANTKPRILRRA
ncbi:MAG TPA: tetratricopeptide repeat protein [Xanthobacteraceae bacterium]|nr:tetratricopeptide repeat protein [Xanthobacteraceae bacterium]